MSVNNQKVYAVLDTGVEISLVMLSALQHVNHSSVTVLSDRHVCDLVGFSGEVTSVTNTVKICFQMGSYTMCKPFEFAIVPD